MNGLNGLGFFEQEGFPHILDDWTETLTTNAKAFNLS
jgi:hypothetical protein